MENYMSIFNGILSTDGTFLDIYLDGLDEHRRYDVQSSDEAGLMQHISSLLTTSTTRSLGLRLLDKFLENCSIEAIEKKGNLWATVVLKTFNKHELQRDARVIFNVLNKIIKISQRAPDFAKSFTSTHVSKVYENATQVPSALTKYALICIETCLRVYPGSSGPSRGIIERFIWKNIDNIDYEVVQNCGKCLHLLQQVKGGGIQGINHKTQWKNYQMQLLGGIHHVYNEMFANCVETYDEKIENENLPWQAELDEFDAEPVKKAAQMYVRCRNLLTYLSIALREPFPVEKPILIKKVLNIIIRGLSVNCLMLEGNPISDNIALSVLLPKLHVDLFNLLNVVLLILRGHVRPYSEIILGLMVDALKWTSAKNVQGGEKNLGTLRKKVYDTISLWCKLFNSANLCENYAEHIFQEIVSDVTPVQNEFTLKVLSGARKHLSKKARRQLQSVQNDKSNAPKNLSETGNLKQQELCIAALRCLQEIIFSVGNSIKPTVLKLMQTSITKTSASFYELPQKPTNLYSNINCRIEIYNSLYAILMATHYLCPPPTELILSIIQTAYTRDESLQVRTHCDVILKNLEKIVHPQKESLLFAIEARDIRNTFIKLGQENLLHEFEYNASNSLTIDNMTDDDITLEVSSSEDNAMDVGNQMQTGNATIVENEGIQDNPLDAPEDVNNSKNITSQVTGNDNEIDMNQEAVNVDKNVAQPDAVINVDETIAEQVHVEDETLSQANHITDESFDNQSKSAESDLPSVDITKADPVNEVSVNEMKYDDEPMPKKQKIGNEESNTNNSDRDDDSILAEIASQFVDELE